MILVTGGTGLVGSHLLLDLVLRDRPVRAIYRSAQSLQLVKKVFSYRIGPEQVENYFKKIDWKAADITDIPSLENAFKDVDLVYHCAALVSFDSSKDSQLRKINIEGTANVVNFCISKKVQKLCYISSIATLDAIAGEESISETSFWNKEQDHHMYAITKYGAEMEVWRASQEGVPVVIVNPGVIIGPGYWDRGSGKIFRKVAGGLDYHFPKVTGFIGVDDVVRIMQELMESPVQNEQFILVSENLSFRTILDLTAQSLQKPVPSKRLRPWMVLIGWISQELSSLFSKKEKLLDRESHKSLFKKNYYDSQKIKAELNYKFEPIEEVIERTAKYYKKDAD